MRTRQGVPPVSSQFSALSADFCERARGGAGRGRSGGRRRGGLPDARRAGRGGGALLPPRGGRPPRRWSPRSRPRAGRRPPSGPTSPTRLGARPGRCGARALRPGPHLRPRRGPPVHQRHLSRVEPALLREHLEAEAGAFFNAVAPLLDGLRAARGSIVAVTHRGDRPLRGPRRPLGGCRRRRSSCWSAASRWRRGASACAPTASARECSRTAWRRR